MTMRPRPFSRSTARGYSLIEMMIVVSMLAFVLLLCTTTLHALFRLNRAERAGLVEASALDRLARRLREDAHAATEARVERPPGKGKRLILTQSDRKTTTYEAAAARDGSVEIDRRSGANGLEARETFTLKHVGAARFEVDAAVSKSGRGGLARLVVTRREDLRAGPATRVFEGAVGRDAEVAREAGR